MRALEKVLSPRVVIWRNDGPMREIEGLDTYVAAAHGSLPEAVELPEHGARFRGDSRQWPERPAGFSITPRIALRSVVMPAGRRVLELFCYTGAWGIQAALAGASSVLCVDASAAAMEGLRQNVELNGLDDRIEAFQGDAFTRCCRICMPQANASIWYCWILPPS